MNVNYDNVWLRNFIRKRGTDILNCTEKRVAREPDKDRYLNHGKKTKIAYAHVQAARGEVRGSHQVGGKRKGSKLHTRHADEWTPPWEQSCPRVGRGSPRQGRAPFAGTELPSSGPRVAIREGSRIRARWVGVAVRTRLLACESRIS